MTAMHVLYIEDNDDDAYLFQRVLSGAVGSAVDVERVDHFGAGLDRLKEGGADVILLDLSLPDSQGLEALKTARCVAPDVPVIVLTGSDDEQLGILAVQHGAQDYLPKNNATGDVLARAIRHAIERQRVLTDLQAARQAERRLAFHDVLTSLPNRQLFRERLDQAIANAQRNHRLVGVLFLDLDGFKSINDTLGHAAGDTVLTVVADRLVSCVRASDTVARLGGDEFTVVVDGVTGPHEILEIAQRIGCTLAPPISLDGVERCVTTSIGISIYPFDGADADTLVNNADAALLSVKQHGGQGYLLRAHAGSNGSDQQFQMEQALRQAVEREQLVVHYEPIHDLVTGRLCGLEALLHWRHPQLGLIGPDRFLLGAEHTGLVTPLVEWTLRTACAQVANWQRQWPEPIRLSVNISGRQLRQPGLAQALVDIVEQSSWSPQQLTLDIDENSMARSAPPYNETLRLIKRTGIELAIDDFGTGSFSLGDLKRLPLDRMKLAPGLVHGMVGDDDDVALARGITSLARCLKLQLTAKGVESSLQADIARTLGCREAQGPFIGSPRTPAEIEAILQPQTALIPG